MRIKIDGGKTEYDGIFAVRKYSTLSLEKSKVSPLMNDIPIIIDITKGGVIDRAGSLVQWMTKVNPAIFKQAAWWSLEPWAYQKYKVYWDKFGCFSANFRQTKLYEVAETDPNFVDFLQLLWIDLISEKYSLQSEVCKDLKSSIETKLMVNLDLSYDDIIKSQNEETVIPEISVKDLEALSNGITINTETGEIIDKT